jgi:gamma-glutamylcyclotransferase (GGCT)/AIG2-like uncharacterized protein YtfP
MNILRKTPVIPPITTIRLFVYGTLKRGYHNHRLVPQAAAIQPAWTWGRLWHLRAGYPALEVPDRLILAHGSDQPRRDARLQVTTPPFPVGKPKGDWDWVSGELVTLADPAVNLPPIDRLEGFRANGSRSFYDRVLVTVWVNDGGLEPVTAWTYDGRQIVGRQERCIDWPPG